MLTSPYVMPAFRPHYYRWLFQHFSTKLWHKIVKIFHVTLYLWVQLSTPWLRNALNYHMSSMMKLLDASTPTITNSVLPRALLLSRPYRVSLLLDSYCWLLPNLMPLTRNRILIPQISSRVFQNFHVMMFELHAAMVLPIDLDKAAR